jgi:integrase
MAVVKSKGRLTCEIKLKVDGRVVRFPGVKDRGVSRQLEARIAKLIIAKTHHQSVPPEVLTWVRNLPTNTPRLFKRLVDEGLVDASLLGRRKLTDLLLGVIVERKGFDDALKSAHRNGNTEEQARRKVLVHRPDVYLCKSQGFLQKMCAEGVTAGHILETISDINAILIGCGFVYWDDLDAETLKQWLHEQRTSRDDFGLTTGNHYITSIKAFADWCRTQLKRQAEANPFEGVKKLDASADIRRKRRSATAEEMDKIVAATSLAGTVKELCPEDRAMLYQVAMTLGPRAGECASLISESFDERDDGMTLIIEASQTKNGKEAKTPVPQALAEILRPWLATKLEGQKLWPGNWYEDAAEMLRKDLAAAGVEEETKDGVLDFHATRHTAITRASRVMPVVDLKTFARHAKIETTMKYVHTDEQQLREGVDRLPAIGGTDGAAPTNTRGPDDRSKKSVRKCVRAGVSKRQVPSSSGNNGHVNRTFGNDTTPCRGKGLSSFDIDGLQRARRDSNPQPPDRQSGTLTN